NPAQGSGKPEIFMNYRGINFYFETKYDLEQAPRQEDVYKVLAYMNNYDVPCGGIIYPGPQLKVSVDVRNKQVIAWIPFTWTEKAFEVAPNYFAFICDRMAAIHSKIGEEDLDKFVEEVERTAFEFYEAIAVPGAVAPEMPEFLYNEEVEIDLDEVMEMEEEDEGIGLDTIAEEASQVKKDRLLEDIEEGNLEEVTEDAGGYSISKDIVEDDNDESEITEETNEFPESVFEKDSQPPEQPIPMDGDGLDNMDKPPEKKISLSIEKLRKMVDEQDK
ncbi:MAG: hypothetical protein ACJZ3J_04065, partial [Candidatus Poseidoniales archaeon]